MSSPELQRELDEVIALLEATVPANPQGPKGQKLEQRLARGLSKYFAALGQAIPIEKLEQIYYELVKQE